MDLGNRLLNLRKEKHLSQEELAEKLDVTRQTISKWETNQSTPDFDKIVPICDLFEITADELLKGEKTKKKDNTYQRKDNNLQKIKKAKGISLGVFLYFIAVVWIIISIPAFHINEILSVAIFLLICGIATYMIVYVCLMYKNEKSQEEAKENKLRKQISDIIAIFTVVIYLSVSFATMAWHITWIIWIIYAVIDEILKLIFMLRGIDDEE